MASSALQPLHTAARWRRCPRCGAAQASAAPRPTKFASLQRTAAAGQPGAARARLPQRAVGLRPEQHAAGRAEQLRSHAVAALHRVAQRRLLAPEHAGPRQAEHTVDRQTYAHLSACAARVQGSAWHGVALHNPTLCLRCGKGLLAQGGAGLRLRMRALAPAIRSMGRVGQAPLGVT